MCNSNTFYIAYSPGHNPKLTPILSRHVGAQSGKVVHHQEDCQAQTLTLNKQQPPKPATVKPQNQVATTFKTVADKHNPAKWVAPTDTTTSTLRGISDLLDNLPLETWFELTRRLLNSISSFPTGAARPLAFLKTVIFFVAEYGSTPYEEEVGKSLALACRKVERLLGREVELENFLNQYAVDICLWSETFLNPIVSATSQADSRWRYSHTSPQWYSPPHSARSEPDPPADIFRQNGKNPYDLRFALPPPDWCEPVRLFLPLTAGPFGRRPEP